MAEAIRIIIEGERGSSGKTALLAVIAHLMGQRGCEVTGDNVMDAKIASRILNTLKPVVTIETRTI